MKRTRHSTEQIVGKLREDNATLAAGSAVRVGEAAGPGRERADVPPLAADEARRLKEVEFENARLKRLGTDRALDTTVLRQANDDPGKPRAPLGGGAL